MKLSVNWLKEYVNINMPIKELADKLTMAGLEVEEIKEISADGFKAAGGAGASDDIIFDVKVTPNRGDWLSILGVAREAAPIVGQKIKPADITLPKDTKPSSDAVKISIKDPKLCRRYVGLVVRNVKLGESPGWIKDRIVAAGMRPINNIVDITNYVMLEYGQPLHAFDLNLLGGNEIIVRTAEEGEIITTLDGNERKLSNQTLVIADNKKPVAIAGVMGGLDSEIDANTTDILIESANFDSVSVRKTSKRLGLVTEASYRYERGVDPNIALLAAYKAATLVAEFAGGEVASSAVDIYPAPVEPLKISARTQRINSMLGTHIDPETMAKYLESLDIETTVNGEMLECTIPTFRPDIEKEIDLVEEVGRMYGYDNLEATLPSAAIGGGDTEQGILRDKMRRILMSSGCQEVLTHSLVSSKLAEISGKTDTMLIIKNPLTEDLNIMRSAIVPNLLQVVQRNQAVGTSDISIFEIGKVYYNRNNNIGETLSVAGLVTGNMWNVSWDLPNEALETDFYTCKGVVENLLKGLGIENVIFTAAKEVMYHPTRTAKVYAGDILLGVLGEISPDICEEMDINGQPCAFELDFDAIMSVTPKVLKHTELSRYPGLYRHVTAVVCDDVKYSDMLAVIKEISADIVESIEVIDLYKGKPIEEGKKSITFALVFRSAQKTLTDEEVNSIVDEIRAKLADVFTCTFR